MRIGLTFSFISASLGVLGACAPMAHPKRPHGVVECSESVLAKLGGHNIRLDRFNDYDRGLLTLGHGAVLDPKRPDGTVYTEISLSLGEGKLASVLNVNVSFGRQNYTGVINEPLATARIIADENTNSGILIVSKESSEDSKYLEMAQNRANSVFRETLHCASLS